MKNQEIELWCQFLDEEYAHLFEELEAVTDPKERSRLKDELIWLKHQMKTFEKTKNVQAIEEDYAWIVKSLSHHLNPKKPFRKGPKS